MKSWTTFVALGAKCRMPARGRDGRRPLRRRHLPRRPGRRNRTRHDPLQRPLFRLQFPMPPTQSRRKLNPAMCPATLRPAGGCDFFFSAFQRFSSPADCRHDLGRGDHMPPSPSPGQLACPGLGVPRKATRPLLPAHDIIHQGSACPPQIRCRQRTQRLPRPRG
jgi:hypothetical protein